ncbi:MAG TPA: hypothetical protein VFI34_08750 [Candidatus Limnocylindrales bacterium]|nr:hypothetical protein [Candidatus Limnocylindrales bacterium]
MMLRPALLSFRMQRFETLIIVGATLISVAVSAVTIWLFSSGGYADCFSSSGPVFSSLCQSSMATWLDRLLRASTSLVPIFPIVAGLLAGGPIVARELETGTARLAWSLGPSRLRWFAQRAVPILAMAGLAGLAIGLTSGALLHQLAPATDLDQSFMGFRNRGPFVAVEALGVAAVALAIGAILGRTIPTLVLTLILVGALSAAIDKVDRTLLLNDSVIASGETFSWDNDLYLESRVKFPNGEVLTYEEAYQTHPEVQMGWDGNGPPPFEDVVVSIPGARYHEIELRESVAVGALAVVFVALAAFAVARRRPR